MACCSLLHPQQQQQQLQPLVQVFCPILWNAVCMRAPQVFMLMQQQQDATRVLQFKHGTVTKMCVTSYETIRKHSTSLAGTFDLLICDEGHRWAGRLLFLVLCFAWLCLVCSPDQMALWDRPQR